MNEYETIFITGDNLTNEQRKCVLDKILTCINENGKIDSIEEMGLKKLAYTIKKFDAGYYYLINFKCNPDLIRELEHLYRITEDIIKFITVRID